MRGHSEGGTKFLGSLPVAGTHLNLTTWLSISRDVHSSILGWLCSSMRASSCPDRWSWVAPSHRGSYSKASQLVVKSFLRSYSAASC